MTDYTKLVAALRNNDWSDACPCCDEAMCKDADCIILQAADAIEALQAENPIVESVLLDKMRQQMEETVCHCNVRENAELIAKILDDDVDGKVFELPKRGKWKITTERFTPELICSECGVHIPCVAGWCMDAHMNYRPNCGAKMEVQDGANR